MCRQRRSVTRWPNCGSGIPASRSTRWWVTSPATITAYDDSAGLTEAFIRNALANIDRTYQGDVDVGNFGYVMPFWDDRQERIDMRLRALEPEHARLDVLHLELDLVAGEELRVEISTKFRLDRFVGELEDSSFEDVEWFTDSAGEFALVLARRRDL